MSEPVRSCESFPQAMYRCTWSLGFQSLRGRVVLDVYGAF